MGFGNFGGGFSLRLLSEQIKEIALTTIYSEIESSQVELVEGAKGGVLLATGSLSR